MVEAGSIICFCMAMEECILSILKNIEKNKEQFAGYSGEAISTFCHSGLLVVYKKIEYGADTERIKAVQYLRMLEGIGDGVTVLPFRIGTIVRSSDHLKSYLEDNEMMIKKLLKRCEASYEYSIRIYEDVCEEKVIGMPQRKDEKIGGYQYLVNKYSLYRRQREGVARYDEAIQYISMVLQGYSSWKKHDNLNESAWPLLFRETYLVHKSNTQDMIAAFGAIKEKYLPLKLVMTGPWLPFTFADDMMNTLNNEK